MTKAKPSFELGNPPGKTKSNWTVKPRTASVPKRLGTEGETMATALFEKTEPTSEPVAGDVSRTELSADSPALPSGPVWNSAAPLYVNPPNEPGVG